MAEPNMPSGHISRVIPAPSREGYPVPAAIAAHRAAYDAFQIALQAGDLTAEVWDADTHGAQAAEDAYHAVGEPLVATVCSVSYDVPARLRWWIAHEAGSVAAMTSYRRFLPSVRVGAAIGSQLRSISGLLLQSCFPGVCALGGGAFFRSVEAEAFQEVQVGDASLDYVEVGLRSRTNFCHAYEAFAALSCAVLRLGRGYLGRVGLPASDQLIISGGAA